MLMLCITASCTTTTGISAHRLKDLDKGDYFSKYETFQHDEIPALLVEGYSGKTVAVELYDQRFPVPIRKDETYIKYGTSQWFYWEGLPAGSYRAVLKQGDDERDETFFILLDKPDKQ